MIYPGIAFLNLVQGSTVNVGLSDLETNRSLLINATSLEGLSMLRFARMH